MQRGAPVPFQVIVKPPYDSLPYAAVVQRVNSGLQRFMNLQPGILMGVTALGMPGNGICEIGELPGAVLNGAGARILPPPVFLSL